MKIRRRFTGTALAIMLALLTVGPPACADWEPLGPSGGWADCVVFRPDDPRVVYAGGDTYGGFYISRDGGHSWTRNPDYGDHNAWCIAVDARRPGLVFAGSMMDTHVGIRKSTDGGLTWRTVLTEPNVASIRFSPADPDVLFAAAGFWGENYQPEGHGAGVWRSTDGGEHWESIGPAMADRNVMDVFPHPTNPDALLAAVYDPFTFSDRGVYASLDGGMSWYAGGLNDTDVWRLVPLPGSPDTVFAVTWQGIYRTDDFGAHWNRLDLDGSLFLSLAISSDDPSHMLAVALGSGAAASTDGGVTWTPVNDTLPAHRCWQAASVPGQPSSFLLTQMGQGIYRTDDDGQQWTPTHEGFRCHYGFVLTPTASGTLLCGFYNEIGNNLASVQEWTGQDWEPLGNSGDRMVRSIGVDPSNPQVLYLSDLNEDAAGNVSGGLLKKSMDGGQSWQTIGNGLPENVAVSVLQVSPSDPNTLLAGTAAGSAYQGGDGVWVSTDGGENWTRSGLAGRQITDLQCLDTDGTSWLAATTQGLYRSTDGGADWQELPGTGGLPVLSMAVSPVDGNTIYIGLYTAGVWKSTDGGATFVPTPLDQRSVTGLAIDPDHPDTVIACGSENILPGWGVWRSDNGGGDWEPFLSGLVNRGASRVLIDPASRSVFAATLGYGVYKRPLTEHDGEPGSGLAVFHVAANTYWETLLRVTNGDGRDHLVSVTATGDAGAPVAVIHRMIPSDGALTGMVRDLFPDVDPAQVRKLVMSTSEGDARLTATVDYRFVSGGEESGLTFSNVLPSRTLVVGHITHNTMWWTGIALSNLSNEPVDVYFRSDTGAVTPVALAMAPGERMSFLMSDLLGDTHTVGSGRFLAYASGSSVNQDIITGTSVDAIAGIEVFGQRIQSHGLSEGFRLPGIRADGDDLDTGFLVPLRVAARPALLNRTTGVWDGISIANPGDQTVTVTIRHMNPDGAAISTVTRDIAPAAKLVFLPEDLGFDADQGGHLTVTSTDRVTVFFLTGDLEDSGGRAILGGGNAIRLQGTGLRFVVPVHRNDGHRSLLTLVNGSDRDATIHFQAHPDPLTTTTLAADTLTLPAHGTRQVEATDLLTEHTGDVLILTSDQAIGLFESVYTADTDKAHANLLGRTVPALPRSMAMGFTPFPYDVTAEAVDETYAFILPHGDLVAEHFDDGVPWPAALAGSDYGDSFNAEMADRLARLNATAHRVYLAVTPLASDRHSLAGWWGSDKNQPLPPSWQDKKLDDPDVITAYTNFCRTMIETFHPDTMNYGIEVNLGFTENDPDYPRLLTLLRSVYTDLKAEYPDLPLFVSLVIGSNIAGPLEEDRINRAILQYSDFVAVSTYPYMAPGLDGTTGNPDKIPDDWFTRMANLAPGKPFAVAETGYQAETLDIPELNIHIPCTPEWQDSYVARLLREADRLDARFVVWFVSRDYDRMWDVLAQQGVSPLAKAWKDNGLLDENGTPRPALTIWDMWRHLPLR